MDVSYPNLFDPNTTEGRERFEQVIDMIDEGQHDSLKEFIHHWNPILFEAKAEAIRKERAEAAAAEAAARVKPARVVKPAKKKESKAV